MKTLTDIDYKFLIDNGFLQVKKFIPDEKIREIDEYIKITKQPTSREDALDWIKEKSKYQRNKLLLDLCNIDIINFLEENIFSKDYIKKVKSCQVAYRFPGEDGSDKYHIDNFTEKDLHQRNRIPNEFSLLVGVCLSDVDEQNHGNFTCFPWSHHLVSLYCKLHGYDYLSKHGLDHMRDSLQFDNEYQITAKKR